MQRARNRVRSEARKRMLRYGNCGQASLDTVVDGMGIGDRALVKAACPLEGGGLSQGSTCGVVSGGCLGIALACAGELEAGGSDAAGALYERLKEYTSWFESEFGSTICRERIGADLSRVSGILTYLITGRTVTRCMSHTGFAAEYLLRVSGTPLETGREGATGGCCAAPVLRIIRERTGDLDPGLDEVSPALDGGIGLSGGMCGALAAALLALGSRLGFDPKTAGADASRAALTGHLNMFREREGDDLWSAGWPLVKGFRKEFGSLECRDITGLRFDSTGDLAACAASCGECSRAIEWCGDTASRILQRVL